MIQRTRHQPISGTEGIRTQGLRKVLQAWGRLAGHKWVGNCCCPIGSCGWLSADANGLLSDEESCSPNPEYKSDGGAILEGLYTCDEWRLLESLS